MDPYFKDGDKLTAVQEGISKKSFRPISAMSPRLPSSPEGYAGQVISTENPNFEIASGKIEAGPSIFL